MVKKKLMLGVAFAALSLIPLSATSAAAQDVGFENGIEDDGNDKLDKYDLDIKADWDSDVDVELDWDVDVDKELTIRGFIHIDGSITADALAQATLDDMQELTGNSVDFEDYQNAYADSGEGNLAEPNPGPTDTADDSEGEPHVASYENTINASFVGSTISGNVGINLAAGDYNMQENAAVLAAADGFFPAETQTRAAAGSFASGEAWSSNLNGQTSSFTSTFTSAFNLTESSSRSARTSGAAEAGSFSLQSLYDNAFNAEGAGGTGADPEWENTDIDNTVNLTDGSLSAATGNIGLNAAAGAFNIQKNALVIASVTGGHLAEATSGVEQHSEDNDSVVEDVVNTVNLNSSLSSASGNIGVNLAAGVGNLQLNTLTIANALGTPPPAGTGTGPGNTGTGPGNTGTGPQ